MVQAIAGVKLSTSILLTLLLLFWPWVSAAGEWKKPPFDLPFEDFLLIPDGRGVSFFYDVWVDYSGRGGGGPMTVTPEVIAHYKSDMPVKEDPYRVLYNGPNYVLFLEKYFFDHDEAWSKFGVFLLQNGPVFEDTPYTALLRHWTCADYAMRNAEAYDWSIEKIEETFWGGWCAKGLSKPYEEWRKRPEHWGSFIYNRQRD